MGRPEKLSLIRRVVLVQAALAATAALRLVNASLAAAAAREESASIAGSGVEGNARVVNGFVSLLLWAESLVSVLHAATALIVVLCLLRVNWIDLEETAVGWVRGALVAYFWVGGAVGLVVTVLSSGFGVVAMLVPLHLGLSGIAVPVLGILVPAAAAWQVRRSVRDDLTDRTCLPTQSGASLP